MPRNGRLKQNNVSPPTIPVAKVMVAKQCQAPLNYFVRTFPWTNTQQNKYLLNIFASVQLAVSFGNTLSFLTGYVFY